MLIVVRFMLPPLILIVATSANERFPVKQFQAGLPLKKEEFLLAEMLHENESTFPFESSVFDDDIIHSSVVKHLSSVENHIWPNGEVPYLLDAEYDEKGRILLARAFKEIENDTCIRFIPQDTQKDYLEISYTKGCSSSVGRIGGPQTVSLGRGCYAVGIMVHELMHALGFIHEQSRSDRDDYVTVVWENVKEGKEDNFKVWNWYSSRILKEKYDYSSILHYNKYAFSKDKSKKPTIIPKKKNAVIGQRKGLSYGDIRKINRVYRCPISY